MKKIYVIDSILPGWSSLKQIGRKGQFIASIGIDPDMPIADSGELGTSGVLRPTAATKISGSEVTGIIKWLVSNPKDTNVYGYANDGKIHVVQSNLTMASQLTQLTNAQGQGSAYYDNYIYFRKNIDVARYGPLNGVAAMTQSYWVGTLGKTALSNTTYPSIRGVQMPNGKMLRSAFANNNLYFCDVNSSGEGIINYIATKKTTVEGDTNNGSTYNALNLGVGRYPTDIENYGTELAISVIEGVDTTAKQTRAKIIFWDYTSASFAKIIERELADPIITALRNINGILFVFSGNANGGFRVGYFVGGYTYKQIYFCADSMPPLAGAIDHMITRFIWGGYTTYPEASASVFARGSKHEDVPMGIHNILKTTSAGANGLVTALAYVQNNSFALQEPLVAWSDDSAKGIDKLGTSYGVNVWRSEMFRIGRNFKITGLHIPLSKAVAANMTLIPKFYIDDESSNKAVKTINNTNYAASERYISNENLQIQGKQNFILELRWSGSALLPVALPIFIDTEIYPGRAS